MKKKEQKKSAKAVSTSTVKLPEETKNLIAQENKNLLAQKHQHHSKKPPEKETLKKETLKREVSKKGNGGFKLNPNSKMGKIRQAFAERSHWSLTELMKKSNFDRANCKCALSIFKNPNKTKAERMIITDYDRKTETYTLVK
jgi:hypothetical protein